MADTPRLDAEHRRLLGLLGLAIFFEGYGRSIVSVMLRPIGQDLGVPAPELSYALAFISAGALGVLVLGHLTDRFGRRRLLLGCVLLYSLLGAATATARTLPGLVAWQAAARMFQEGALSAAVVIAVEETPALRRGLAQGVLGVANSIGSGLGAFLLGFIGLFPRGWRGLCLGGRLTDRVGGRPSAAVFLVGLALAEAAFFLGGPGGLWPSFTAMVFCQAGKTTVLRSWAPELFPTSLRGTASSQLTAGGVLGAMAGLAAAGALGAALADMGLGIALVASAGVVAAVLAYACLPETGGLELEVASPEAP